MTIRPTVAFDPATAARLERLAKRWGVSKSETMRRALESAEKTTPALDTPDTSTLREAMKKLLSGGIIPFEEAAASLAGELFHLTGSKRRTRLDTMIAASAILSGAELATSNPG